jgi:CubicO group peptidase (beta-lactamase class C family)
VVAREIAAPLGADFHIGVPWRALPRVAEFVGLGEPPPAGVEARPADQAMEFKAYFNPPTLSGAGVVNSTEWRTAELPSTNAHASARGIARLYEVMVNGGAWRGLRVVDEQALAEATTEQVSGPDLILHRPSRFGIGFQLTQDERRLGPNQGSFGHFGAGGSLGFCDPAAKVAFGYAINTMGPRWQNPRNQALIDACYDCL